jgi:hypothetical protein
MGALCWHPGALSCGGTRRRLEARVDAQAGHEQQQAVTADTSKGPSRPQAERPGLELLLQAARARAGAQAEAFATLSWRGHATWHRCAGSTPPDRARRTTKLPPHAGHRAGADAAQVQFSSVLAAEAGWARPSRAGQHAAVQAQFALPAGQRPAARPALQAAGAAPGSPARRTDLAAARPAAHTASRWRQQPATAARAGPRGHRPRARPARPLRHAAGHPPARAWPRPHAGTVRHPQTPGSARARPAGAGGCAHNGGLVAGIFDMADAVAVHIGLDGFRRLVQPGARPGQPSRCAAVAWPKARRAGTAQACSSQVSA